MVLAGDTDSKERWALPRVSSRYYTLGILPLIYLHNSSTIWVGLEKKTKEVHHDWILTIQVSFGVENVSVPVVSIYIDSSLRAICKWHTS